MEFAARKPGVRTANCRRRSRSFGSGFLAFSNWPQSRRISPQGSSVFASWLLFTPSFPPLPPVPVTASGNQSGVRRFSERGFSLRQPPVNFCFCLPCGSFGGALCRPLSALVFVVRCAYLAQHPAPHIFRADTSTLPLLAVIVGSSVSCFPAHWFSCVVLRFSVTPASVRPFQASQGLLAKWMPDAP